MAKGAADSKTMSSMHALLAKVMTRVLERYLENMDIDLNAVASEEMLDAIKEPSPAMLSAIASFLKQNEIMFDSKDLAELNTTEQRLKDRRKAREASGFTLKVVPLVAEA